jgi:hypothetical protein
MAKLVDVHVLKAETIDVVLDHLSTHMLAALYEVFPRAYARRVLWTLELHMTPVPGSWLNTAEIELPVLARQCLNRGIPDATTMARKIAAWEESRNRHRATIDKRFRTKDAHLKLTGLYPKESMQRTTSRPNRLQLADYKWEI